MSERAPEERLWDLLRGALGTRALGIVAELGIADRLADGPAAGCRAGTRTLAPTPTRSTDC